MGVGVRGWGFRRLDCRWEGWGLGAGVQGIGLLGKVVGWLGFRAGFGLVEKPQSSPEAPQNKPLPPKPSRPNQSGPTLKLVLGRHPSRSSASEGSPSSVSTSVGRK